MDVGSHQFHSADRKCLNYSACKTLLRIVFGLILLDPASFSSPVLMPLDVNGYRCRRVAGRALAPPKTVTLRASVPAD
jgi:hypothetical protein